MVCGSEERRSSLSKISFEPVFYLLVNLKFLTEDLWIRLLLHLRSHVQRSWLVTAVRVRFICLKLGVGLRKYSLLTAYFILTVCYFRLELFGRWRTGYFLLQFGWALKSAVIASSRPLQTIIARSVLDEAACVSQLLYQVFLNTVQFFKIHYFKLCGRAPRRILLLLMRKFLKTLCKSLNLRFQVSQLLGRIESFRWLRLPWGQKVLLGFQSHLFLFELLQQLTFTLLPFSADLADGLFIMMPLLCFLIYQILLCLSRLQKFLSDLK